MLLAIAQRALELTACVFQQVGGTDLWHIESNITPAGDMADEKKRDDDHVIDIGDRKGRFDSPSRTPQGSPSTAPIAAVANNPIFPVLSYCASSILMTVTNKYVLSGLGFNLNFFLLAVQVSEKKWPGCDGALISASPSSALLPSKPARALVSLHIETSTPTRQENVSEFPRFLKQRLTTVRVSGFTSPDWHNIHQHQSSTVSLDSCLHHLQKLDHHLDCLW